MKDIYVFPAVFSYADDGITVTFPDLPGCITCGETDEEALRMAKDALGGHLWAMEDDHDDIPAPTAMIDIAPESNERIVLVDVYMPLIRKSCDMKSVKKTLSIPAWMDTAARAENINFSQLLQDAIVRALKHNIAQ